MLLKSCRYVVISVAILVNLQMAMKVYMVFMVMAQKTRRQYLLLLTILLFTKKDNHWITHLSGGINMEIEYFLIIKSDFQAMRDIKILPNEKKR